MFSGIRNFISRHRRKLITGGLIIGGVIVLSRYARSKLYEWQNRKMKEFLEKTRKTQHFESTERTCNQTIVTFFRSLTDALTKQLSTDNLVEQLKSAPENKINIWNEIKLVSFCRITSFIYGSVLLVAILRVQVNLIGGYLFKNPDQLSSELQEKYLSLCQRFLNDGLSEMIENIKLKVNDVVKSIDLKKKMALEDVEQLFWSIQAQLSNDLNDPILRVAEFLLGNHQSDESELYRTILFETRDLLESEEIRSICNSNISRSFSFLIDTVSEYYSVTDKTRIREISEIEASTVSSFNKVEIPMVKLIPIISGLLASTGDSTSDTKSFRVTLAHLLILNEPFKTLGANIYESFSCDVEATS